MARSTRHVGPTSEALSRGQHRARRWFIGLAVGATALLGTAAPAVAATTPTLVVVVLGSGTVTSAPAGIACPGKCSVTFATPTSVILTPAPKNGSTFLGWGGSCTGTGPCHVKVPALTAVAAQFGGGAKAQPQPAVKYLAAPGPYSGAEVGAITFDVAPGGKSMLNISQGDELTCTPSAAFDDRFEMLQVAVQPNGSFRGTTSQSGILSGNAATYTYTIAGHFEAATATSVASAAGTYSESIKFTTGTKASCTTNQVTWTATLTREPPLPKVVATPGNYSGADVGSITFSVGPTGKSMLDVSQGDLLSCSPSGAVDDKFQMLQVTIQPNGSFTGKASHSGVFMGANATFTYTIAGYFEGKTPYGPSTVAGIFRENVVPSSGTTKMCTSDNQFWLASLHS
jgi:hypothetical protein